MTRTKTIASALAAVFVASTVLVSSPALAIGKKAEHEGQQVTLDQVPAPVKAALEKEAQGGTIGTITEETQKNKTYYEAAVEKNGKQRYVHVSPEGKILKRESAKREAREEKREK